MKNIIFTFFLFLSIISLSCAQTLPHDIDISGSPNGVIDLPNSVSSVWHNNGMVKYTKLTAPNGKAIHFVAQNQLTDAQIVRSRNILQFFLTDFPGSQYGADKSAIANQMTENNAILLLLNGADGQGNDPDLPGQYLFEDEIAVEGHARYINNDFEHRDAAFEEILHLMHDTGIGVDGPNSFPGAASEYQAEIRAAQINANQNNFAIWPIGADGSIPEVQDWFNELDDENSLSQEYLASVVDSYYGLWGPFTDEPGGMWGIYIAKTRADMETLDPMGTDLMAKYFSPHININMDIDPSFNGTFSMSFDAAQLYTHKSQYLQHCTLTGSNNSNLKGNDMHNRLIGNDSNNELEGGKGNDRLNGKGGDDIAIFSGNCAEYTVLNQNDLTFVIDNINDRDGADTLSNIETIRFADKDTDVALGIENINSEQVFMVFPNPADDFLTVEFNVSTPIKSGIVKMYDGIGKLVLEQKFNNISEHLKLNIDDLPAGNYSLQIIGNQRQSSRVVIIN